MVPDLPVRCVIVSRPFRPAFPFRCVLLAQRLRSVRLVSRYFVRRSFSVSVPSVASPVYHPRFRQFRSVPCCVARRSPVLPAPSASFPVTSCLVHPVPFPRLPVFLFSLTLLSSTLDALYSFTHLRRVIHYSVTSFLLFDVLIIKSSSFGFDITRIPCVWLRLLYFDKLAISISWPNSRIN